MLSTNPRLKRSILFPVLAALGLACWAGSASAQLFDPYQPYASTYYSSSVPSVPNNLALPNAAREANQYNNSTPFAGSRYNTFERYLNDGVDASGPGAVRRGGGAGVPYYDAYRQLDREYHREYTPNRVADQGFYAREAERNRRYQTAMREKDPVKRAQLLRKVNDPVNTRPAAAPATARPVAGATTPARTDPIESLAAEGLSRVTTPVPGSPETAAALDPTRAPAPAPRAGTDTRALTRRREAAIPDRRPLLPSEIMDRNGRRPMPPASPPAAGAPR